MKARQAEGFHYHCLVSLSLGRLLVMGMDEGTGKKRVHRMKKIPKGYIL